MSVEALTAPQPDSAAATIPAPIDTNTDTNISDDDALGAAFDRVSRDNGAARENGRFASPKPNGQQEPTNEEPLEGGGGEDTEAADTSTPAADVPLPSSWRGKEELWGKIPAEVKADLRAHQEGLHKTLSQQGQALSAFKPLSDVFGEFKEYFNGERGQYKPDEAVRFLFAVQRSMDDKPVETILDIADRFEVRDKLIAALGGTVADPAAGGRQNNEQAFLTQISQLKADVARLSDPSKIDERITKKLTEDRQQLEVDEVISRVSKDMPLYDQIPEPDLVTFIQVAKQKLGSAASHEAVLKRAYDMAVHADPDLRAKAAALASAAATDPDRVAAAKRANATNLRSTSSGRARELTQEEELEAVYDKHKG